MTEFKPNITESIDNLNQANNDINVLNEKFKDVYSDETADFIDQVLEDNIDTKAGTSLELNNTVDKGKMDYKAKGDTFQLTYSGKNLIVNSEVSWSTTTTDIAINNNSLAIGTYIFSSPDITVTGQFNIYGVDENDTQETIKSNSDWQGISSGVSFTTTKIYTKLRIYTNIAVTGKVQLESGSTATSWEPYVGGIPAPNPDYPQDIKVVTGENSVVISNKNLLTYNTITEGKIIAIIDGTLSTNQNYGVSDYIPVKANQEYYQNNTNTYYGCFYDKNKNFVSQVQNQKIITPSVDGYVRVSFLLTNKDLASVNKGNTAITYEKGISQIITVDLKTTELCKIGDYQDYIYGTKDNWKIKRYIGKVVSNGSEEGWLKQDATFRINKTSLGITLIENSLNLLCNQYKFQTTAPTLSGQARIGVTNLIFKYDDGSISLADFKTWLSNNNLIMYYQLAESTETNIEDEDIIDDLNDLYDATFYAEQTNITVTNANNLPLILDVTYFVTEKEE